MQSALFKNKENNLKKDASNLKINLHSKRQKKNIEKIERKMKNEKKSNCKNNKYLFVFTILYVKICILFENIFGKT